MKRAYLLLIIVLIYLSNINAQTYRQLFDNIDNTYIKQTGYYSFHSNLESKLTFEAYHVIQAYINMYKATKDIKYLNEFVIHAKRVMDRRDDHIQNTSPISGFPIPISNSSQGWWREHTIWSSCSMSGTLNSISDAGINNSYPAWSRREYNTSCILTPYPHHMETGIITYPMAEFVLLTINNPDLLNVSLPTEAAFTGVSNYGQFATWLKTRLDVVLRNGVCVS